MVVFFVAHRRRSSDHSEHSTPSFLISFNTLINKIGIQSEMSNFRQQYPVSCMSCPICKTSEFQNRSLVMMINECCHPICQNCCENLFARNIGPCPYENCGKMLKRSAFWVQNFTPRVERENFVRKRINKIFNLQEDDFPDLRAFNDYLEKVEDIVFRLANEINVDEVENEIQNFQEQHTDLIERNKRKPTKDDLWIRAMLEEEQARQRKLHDEYTKDQIEKAQNQALFNPKAIIEELKSSNLPAEVVLDRQRKKQIEYEMAEKEEAERRKRDKQEGKRAVDRHVFGSIRPSGKQYIHKQLLLSINGPALPSEQDLEEFGYIHHIPQATISALAGGYTTTLSCQRALLEAHSDLFAF